MGAGHFGENGCKKKLFQLCVESGQVSSIQCTCIRLLNLLNQPLSYITVFLRYNAPQTMKILFPNLVNFSGDCFNQVHFFSISWSGYVGKSSQQENSLRLWHSCKLVGKFSLTTCSVQGEQNAIAINLGATYFMLAHTTETEVSSDSAWLLLEYSTTQK